MEMTNIQPWPPEERRAARARLATSRAIDLAWVESHLESLLADRWPPLRAKLLAHAPADLAAALDEIERLNKVLRTALLLVENDEHVSVLGGDDHYCTCGACQAARILADALLAEGEGERNG
jgi:hypothetical protein